jgi:hypothetical protein
MKSNRISLVLLVLGLSSALSAGEALTAASVMPAKIAQSNGNVQMTDGQGGSWQLEYQGTLESRTISNLHLLRMDGNWNFNAQTQPQVTSDGQEGVATATYNAVQIVRRVRSMPTLGLVRIVDVFINTSGKPVTTTVSLYSNLNWSPVQVLGDQGQVVTTALGAKDSGLVMPVPANYQPHGYRDVLLGLCSPKSRHKPTVQMQGNTLILSWPLTIPAGKAVALVHAVTERPFGTAINPKAVKTALAGMRARAFLADLPVPLRKVVLNWSGSSAATDDAPELAGGIPEDLIAARGSDADLLALGAGTRLRGEATGIDVPVRIDGANHRIPWDEIMALHGGAKPAVFLRTGDVLTGAQGDGTCTFTLATGQQVPMTLQRIGWLLRRPQGNESLPPGEVLIQLDDHQRLVGKPAGSHLQCSTLWGQLDLRLEDIASLTPEADGGSRIVLRDGSRFSGLLTDGLLTVETRFTGRRTIALNRITGIVGGKIGGEETEDNAPVMPHATLVGDQLFMGIVDLPELHLRLEGNRLPVPPPQIRLLVNQSESDSIGLDHLLPRLRLELWSGDVAEGLLEESALPLRTAGGTLLIPPCDVVEVHVPIPVVAPATRARIAELVAQLGDRDWTRREAAVKAMVQLGEVVRQPTEEALQATKDAEVKARLEQVLHDLK